MSKCEDHWCEHYEKNKGNCCSCIKNEAELDKSNLSVILKKRAVKQMEIDKPKSKGQGKRR